MAYDHQPSHLLFIMSPWETGYIESFKARIRDELLNGKIFHTLAEARIVIESWRHFYNTPATRLARL